MKKIALVLEGGGMRALFSAGVLDALLELDLSIDTMVSVSAGALFGVNYASKQKERAVRYNLKYAGNKNYMSFSNWIKTGNVLGKQMAFYDIPLKLDKFDQEKFKNSKIEFYIVLTNVNTGRPEYVLITDVFKQMEYFRATSALPFVSKIIKINGKKYLDGGITDSIPVNFSKKLGCEKIIVILTRPKGLYREEKLKWIYKIVYRNYPRLLSRLLNMEKEYKENLKKINIMEEKKEIFVIRPEENLNIGRLEKDKQKIKDTYIKGFNKGKKELERLTNFLNNKI